MTGADDLKDLLDRLKGEVSRAADPALPPEPPFRRDPEPGDGLPGTVPGPPPAYGPPVNRDAPPPRTERFRQPFGSAPFDSAQGGQGGPESAGPGKVPAAANLIWSENKETMLFGMLASLVVLLGGVAASMTWLAATGAVFFALFSALALAVLSGYARHFRGAPVDDGGAGLAAKLEQLSRKVDGLVLRGGAAQSSASGAFKGGSSELEWKVEELRTLVKSLAKAVGDK